MFFWDSRYKLKYRRYKRYKNRRDIRIIIVNIILKVREGLVEAEIYNKRFVKFILVYIKE